MDRIDFKVKNKLYHHLVTFEKWQENEMQRRKENAEKDRKKRHH